MKLKQFNTIILVAVIFITSCTPYKKVPYFQNLKRDSVTAIKEKISNFSPLTIQPGDLLAMHVTSLNHEADAQFNYNLERPSALNTATNGRSLSSSAIGSAAENVVYGYLVDYEGNINLPLIGKIKAAGYTNAQLTTTLETSLAEFLSKPTVDIRIQNFKISILGDVAKPGSFDIPNEQITLLQAIALAGDLNTTGIRNNVLLIREINGNRETITLDLNSKKIFNSPYYYLKNNDVIYVQPNKERVSSSDTGYVKASIILSALSVLAIFLTKL